MLLRVKCGLEMYYNDGAEIEGLCMNDYKGQQTMYNRGLHGKVRHSEELGGIYGFRAYPHYVQAFFIECGLCQLRRATPVTGTSSRGEY